MTESLIVGVVGNPNCGKTTLFNRLTGSRQQVGNWSGVTVEKKTGLYSFHNKKIQLVDLPGTYSLESDDDSVSIDERIARDYVASREANLIINILDASNIERNLYLTSQLLEMRVPMIVVLNMMDAAQKRGIRINAHALSEQLGCPVVEISAVKAKGIKTLLQVIDSALISLPIPNLCVDYGQDFESAVHQLQLQITDSSHDTRWIALRLLEGDTLARSLVTPNLYEKAVLLRREVEDKVGEEIDIVAADARYGFVNNLVQFSVSKMYEVSKNVTDRIDSLVLNRFLGVPVFFFVMYCMFMFTINIGSAFVDFFDKTAGAILVDWPEYKLTQLGWNEWVVALLTQGVGGGIQVVSTFIPVVGFLFIFLSILEDTGYMARAAFVMDRFMIMIGLPGKSFVPMIIGFGCNVPAIIATRTLDNERDRILTNMMNPFMSCGARLPVYALFAAAFFPVNGQNVVFGLYLLGIFVAVLTGLIMRHTVLKGRPSPFLLELPPYHFPTFTGVYAKTIERLKGFVVNAGKLIVPMVVVLNLLNSLGVDGSFGRENSENSVLSSIGRSLTPIFKPMGISDNNWQATVGIFTGVLAKEAVVGTLNALYSQAALSAETPSDTAEQPYELQVALNDALQTIPENLGKLREKIMDPLGLSVGNLENQEQAATEQEVDVKTYQVMRERFQDDIAAFSYLLFILLYTPCVAATAAIYRETGSRWAGLIVFWTTFTAYISATLYYQLRTFEQHPVDSLEWSLGVLLLMILVVMSLRVYGKKTDMGTVK
jgi:ferrous iron transport protein B